MEYKAFEMHTHTLHSDGTFTVEELCRNAKRAGFDAIALTDHNTVAPYEELTHELEEMTLPVIRGIEWTTFFGHMVVLGSDRYIDWRLAAPNTIDQYLREIHDANGVAGIAHPFSLGSPFCTGCHWQYNVKDWEQIDYIEIWSGAFPQLNPINPRAFQWWTDLLNRGFHIAATQGRDWHGPSMKKENMSATYLGVEGGVINTETAREALRRGRSYVTCGPGLSLEVEQGNRRAGLGEAVKPGRGAVHISADTSLRREYWDSFHIRLEKLAVVQNGAPVAQVSCGDACSAVLDLSLWPGWIRLEAIGDYMDREDTLLAFTSPIYVAY